MTGGLQEQVTDGQKLVWMGRCCSLQARRLLARLQVPYIYEDRMVNQDEFEEVLSQGACSALRKRITICLKLAMQARIEDTL